MFDLYDEYCHGRMDRREFLAKSAIVTAGGLAMAQALLPRYATAQTISFIRSEHVAAERAMNVKLRGEARQRERQVLGALKANRKRKAKHFEQAAGTAGAPAPASGRRRPRQRRKRDVKGNPRPRR